MQRVLSFRECKGLCDPQDEDKLKPDLKPSNLGIKNINSETFNDEFVILRYIEHVHGQRISPKNSIRQTWSLLSISHRLRRSTNDSLPSAGSSPAPNQKSLKGTSHPQGTSHPHLDPGSLEMIHKCWYYGLIVGTMDWWGLIVDPQLFGTIHINYQFPSIPYSHIGSQNYEIEHIPAECWLLLLVWQKQWIGLGEHLQENSIFDGKNHGLRLKFSLKPIHWQKHQDDVRQKRSELKLCHICKKKPLRIASSMYDNDW